MSANEMLKKFKEYQKNTPRKYGNKDREEEMERFGDSLKRYNKEQKSLAKLTTEKQHKKDYKQTRGNIQKSRSDLHVNKKTGKREITTNMTILKGLTDKEKSGLKKSILKAVKQHLEGSGLHIPLAGGYTSSLIFHEMGKYIPPKDRKLMAKLIEESRPPRPPPIHSGAIDEEIPLAVIPPMDTGNMSASDYEDSGTESESDKEVRYKYKEKEPDSDSDLEAGYGIENMFGHGISKRKGKGLFDNPIQYGVDKAVAGLRKVGDSYKNAVNRDINKVKLVSSRINNNLKKAGTGIKRPRGRPRKIQL